MFRLAQFSSVQTSSATTTTNSSSSSSSGSGNTTNVLDHTFDNIFLNILSTDSSFLPPSQQHEDSNNHSIPSYNKNSNSNSNSNQQQQQQHSSLIEIGKYAVWSVSTAKQGNGVEELRDDNLETYWQSDGPQPHTINIQFHKVLTIQEVAIYLDYKKDESYTPQVISIKCGSNFHDLIQIKTIELEEPVGYVNINMLNSSEKDLLEHCRCNMLQIVISQNHQNGRDTHVRQVKVYGPVEHLDHSSNINPIDLSLNNSNASNQFDTLQFSMFSTLR
ncbi:anaphase promoting complex subunit 10 [Naegleria gruberi]|uniref:Anaphase promoting complex subunit 10 n=1 Tax=Naegleria gruberi TaxID=5762 RepID=D2VD12_NAEGR|nr:anaphase promoting complex subunit 10 [Naegleria gruberi]EFC45514.1 anaphase promoting complex subunit 10 [Naegleria gruberi]|eukprot:XP_002678258.1 anaphase promoting complex subunit 10 [Naegleria gruberi strain NEG-M]